ncbi:MAG: methionine--tRNA ligase subunit beta [Candidatus Omnitrophica bacterium]|nr:methionine--tRNA ligase subunit beta [Candidatus Omnitrophota bacterium]
MPASEPAQPEPKLIPMKKFAKIDLRIAQVLEASFHPDADKLLVLKVDLGEEAPRQLVAGIRSDYGPEALVGRQVVVVANLQPATIRGVESRGMILAVRDTEGIALLAPDRPKALGSRVS